MVHSKNRSRGCRKEKEGEGSNQPTRRKHMRLGVEGAEILRCLRKKLKAAARRALRKEIARLVDNSQIPNLVQEQVERIVQEQGVERIVQEQVGRLVLEQVGRLFPNSEPSNMAPNYIEAGLAGNSGQSESRMATIPANSEAGLYRLQFLNDMPEYLYTCTKLKSKDKKYVEIAIFNTVRGCITTSSPWSSAKVEVVVLDDDFCADVQEGRANIEELREHIMKSRKGKGPLLLGEVVIKLDQGVGRLTDITFTDNSAWTRSKKFRLGLTLHQNGVTDVEAGMSDPFRVKDRRVKGNEKHHPPRLTEEVHHLEKISKNGEIHKRLMDNGIITTQQILQAYYSDPKNLRRVIGGKKGVAEATWETIIKHASECSPGDELYSYDATEQGMKLIFNSIFQLRGVYYGGRYCEATALTVEQQGLAQNLKKQAFQNVKSIELFNPPVTVGSTSNPLRQTFHPNSAEEMDSFIRQHPSGGSPGVLSSEAPWCHELPCDMPLREDNFCHLSPIQLPPYFTTCQEATTSYCAPAIGEVDHPFDQEGEINVMMFFGYRHQWVRVIAGLKCVILIAKYLDIRRSGKISF